MDGASSLKKAFRESPGIADIVKIAADSGVTEEQALMDTLFMLKLVQFKSFSIEC